MSNFLTIENNHLDYFNYFEVILYKYLAFVIVCINNHLNQKFDILEELIDN